MLANRIAIWPALLIVGACVGDRPDDTGTTHVASDITVDTSPIVSIGDETSGDYQFSGVVTARRLSSGDILVADGGSLQLRLYDEHGRLTRRAGGSGEGPGEFRDITWAEAAPSGLFHVYDSRLRRLSVFDPDLALTRTFRVGAVEGLNLEPLGFLADTTFIWSAWKHPSEEQNPIGSVFRIPISYLSTTLAATVTSLTPSAFQLVAEQPGRQVYAHDLAGPGQRLIATVPFSALPLAFVTRGRLYLATGDSLHVRVYDSRGTLVEEIDDTVGVGAVTREAVTALQENLARTSQSRDGPRVAEADVRRFHAILFARVPLPREKPAVEALVVDAMGDVWVGLYRDEPSGQLPRAWRVFSADGRRKADLRLPGRFRIQEIGGDYILGVRTNELDVERIQLLRLIRR